MSKVSLRTFSALSDVYYCAKALEIKAKRKEKHDKKFKLNRGR